MMCMHFQWIFLVFPLDMAIFHCHLWIPNSGILRFTSSLPSSMHLRLSSHFEIFEWVRNSKAIFCLCKGAKVCNCHLWSECMTSFSQKKCWAPARHHHLAARHQLVVLPLWCPAPRYIWFFSGKMGVSQKGKQFSRFFVSFASRWSTMVHCCSVIWDWLVSSLPPFYRNIETPRLRSEAPSCTRQKGRVASPFSCPAMVMANVDQRGTSYSETSL